MFLRITFDRYLKINIFVKIQTKNMKKLIVLLFITCSFSSMATDFDWGKAFDAKTDLIKILGEIDNKIYTISAKKSKLYLDIFNKELSLTKSKELIVKGDILEVFNLDNNISVLSYIHDKSKKEVRLYSNPVSSAGIVGRKDNLIMIIPLEKKRLRGTFDLKFSPDSSKVMFFHQMEINKGASTQLKVKIVDTKFDGLTSETHNFKQDKKSYLSFEYGLSNSGKYYVLKTTNTASGVNYTDQETELIQYDNTGHEIHSKKIDFKYKHLSYHKLVFAGDNSDKVVALGYYYTIPEKRRGKSYNNYQLHGVWSAVYNENDLSLIGSKDNEFSDDFYESYYGKRRYERLKEKGKLFLPIAPAPLIKDIVTHDKGFYIVSEQYIYTESRSSTMITKTTQYGQIFIMSMDYNGELTWMKNIVKNQIHAQASPALGGSIGGGGLSLGMSFGIFLGPDKTLSYSYLLSPTKDGIQFLYLDHFKNIGKDSDEIKPLNKPKKGVPFLVKINSEGELTKKPLLNDNTDIYIAPRLSLDLGDGNFILYGEKKSEKRLAYLTL